MGPCPSLLYLVVQLAHVVGQCQQDRLRFYIYLTTAQEPAETAVPFQFPKRTLCLDTPVHPQFAAFLTYYPFQVLFPIFKELFGDIQRLAAFLQRFLAVVPFNAFLFLRAVLTFLADVHGCLTLVTRFCFFLFYMAGWQLFPIAAGVAVCFTVIFHIFYPADVTLVLLRL